MPMNNDRLAEKYILKCRRCGRKRIQVIDHALGLKVGDVYPHDPSNHDIGQCQGCKTWDMEITDAPEAPPLPGPKGFTEVPKE